MKILYLRIKKLFKLMFNLIRFGTYDPDELVVLTDRQLVYVVNSKVACSSIKATFLSNTIEDTDDGKVHDELSSCTFNSLPPSAINYQIFTFVRNPFDRLVSCYLDKFVKEKSRNRNYMYFDDYLFGYFSGVDNFTDFVNRVCRLPVPFCDRHFKLQSVVLEKFQHLHWGKFETINQDFTDIQAQYHLGDLPHLNRNKQSAKKWRDFYDKKTANMVYQYYRKDFQAFGYGNELNNLLEYIESSKGR